MAIDYNGARLIATAIHDGWRLGRVLTLGSLDLKLSPSTTEEVLERSGLAAAVPVDGSDQCTAAEFLRRLGATEVHSMDYSGYEGAEIVQDLNEPLPHHLAEGYDTIIDSGTLEHVFNIPEALMTIMKLARVGGGILIHTPVNNAFGHGLYQFSPELFYRSFSPDNGFSVMRMIVHECTRESPWYDVRDPKAVGYRADVVTSLPTYLFLAAQKTAKTGKLFTTWPQQSDYSEAWDAHQASQPHKFKIPYSQGGGSNPLHSGFRIQFSDSSSASTSFATAGNAPSTPVRASRRSATGGFCQEKNEPRT